MKTQSKLDRRLRALRHRLAGREALTALAVALAVSIAGLSLLILIMRLDGGTNDWSRAWLWLPGAFVFVLAAVLIIRLRTVPGVLQLARRTDAELKLTERLSSALENRDQPEPGSLSELLEADAEKHAELIDPYRMVPIRPSPVSVGLVCLSIVSVFAAWLLPLTQPQTAADVQNQSEQLAEAEIKVAVEDILAAAETIREAAETRQDPYLAAVANRLQELTEQLEAGDVSRSELGATLSELRHHLSLADTDDMKLAEMLPKTATWPTPPPGTDAGDEQAGEPTDASAQPPSRDDSSAAPPPEPDAPGTEQPTATGDGSGGDGQREPTGPIPLDYENLEIGNFESDPEERRTATYADIDPELMARLEERREQLQSQRGDATGAVPVGAAEQSTAGGGDLGGDGEGGADSELLAMDEADFGFSDEMQLPFDEDTDGQRITIEASPDVVATDVDGIVRNAAAGWRDSEEPPLNPEWISLRHQTAVSRYFQPQADEE